MSDSLPLEESRFENRQARIRSLVNGIPEPTSIRHSIMIPSLSPIPLLALVDTGATDSFYSRASFSKSLESRKRQASFETLSIPVIEDLPRPIPLNMFDGTPARDLRRFIRSPIISAANKAPLELPLFETDLPSDIPIILGMDYLRQTKPIIDWDGCKLSFPSPESSVKNNISRALAGISLPHSNIETPSSLDEKSFETYNSPVPSRRSSTTSYTSSVSSNDMAMDLPRPRLGLVTLGNHSKTLEVPSNLSLASSPHSNPELSHFFDPDEDPDDIADILRIVPKNYHDLLDVFSKARAEALPPQRPYDHAIDLLDEKDLPPLGPIYSTSPVESKALKEEIDTLMAKGAIRPSSSAIGAPVLFVKKKEGTLRMCIDYRQLNLRTKKNKYPLPPINFLLEQLSGASMFSKIDLRGAYHLLRVAPGHEWKTTFRCRYGSFEFRVMPFGLTNAPSSFQHYINDVLHEFVDKFVVAYLDDILIFSKNATDHSKHVRVVLETLRKHSLYAKATKCIFHASSVDFLGYIVGIDGLAMDPGKVKTILDWPKPKTVKAVQSFLGFANFYRRFIRDYSKVVSPLTALTKKDATFEWTSKADSSFESLKTRFTTAPILRHFDPALAAFLETDASDYAIGSILSQAGEDGMLHPVAFDSRKLAPAELNYAIHDKELLAIVWSFSRWRSHLLGAEQQIQVLTDHNALEYFMTSKQLTRRQARWAELLSEYNFLIKYRPGKQSEKPDALSRRDDVYPSSGEGSYSQNNTHNFRPLINQPKIMQATSFLCEIHYDYDLPFLDALLLAQQQDPQVQRLREQVSNTTRTTSATLEIRVDGILLFNGKIYVPNDAEIRLRILRMYHDHPVSGHQGRDKTLELITRKFEWPDSRTFVMDYIASCGPCTRNKPRRHKPYGLLQSLPIPEQPWHSISMDHIEQLPLSRGHDSILVVVDRFSKMAIFIATTVTATSKDLAGEFLRFVASKHGCPQDIVSDRGSKFVSKFWRAVTERLGIKRNLSTAYHPQSDGQTERVNQTLEQYIRMYCAYQQDDWYDWLPLAEIAYNNSKHSASGQSPFFINYGFHPSFDLVDGISASIPGKDFTNNLESIHSKVRETLEQSRKSARHFADKRRSESFEINVGDLVMLSSEHIRTTRPTRKFSERYIGPYKVLEQVSKVAFRLELPLEMRRVHPVFHISLLEPFKTSNIPGRTPQPPPHLEFEDEDIFEPKQIVDSRFRNKGKKIEYRVEWAGYENHPDRYTWEPAINLKDASDIVIEFHEKFPDKPRL